VITCQEADVLAAALSVGSIDVADQAALQAHLVTCADCRRVAGEYMAAAARLPVALEPVAPSAELRGRVMRAVYAEAEQAGRRTGATHPASWWRRLWTAVPASRGLTVAAAAAAVAVIALSWAVSHQTSAPATVAVTLAGTQAAPQAHAVLSYQRGSADAVLTASGLPDPGAVSANDAVYEVWLIRSNGSVVAAAYLSRDPDGTWGAALHGDLSAYTAVAATAEPPGGSQAPTGARVLQGSLRTS
jgi:anti-sigma-K factor RskA